MRENINTRCGAGRAVEYVTGETHSGPYVKVVKVNRTDVDTFVHSGDVLFTVCRRCIGSPIRPCDYSDINLDDLNSQFPKELEALGRIPVKIKELLSQALESNVDKIGDKSRLVGPVSADDVMDLMRGKIQEYQKVRPSDIIGEFEDSYGDIRIAVTSSFPDKRSGLTRTMSQKEVVDDAYKRTRYLAELFKNF